MDVKLTDLQKLLIRTIDEVRAEHHSCTAREVARRTKLNASYVNDQIVKLINVGLVASTELPGSLRVVDQDEPAPPTPALPQVQTPAVPAKRPATKKAPAKRPATKKAPATNR